IELLDNYKLQAIIGPQKSSEAVLISKIGNITRVPIVSFTATSPSLTSDTMPYFVRATLNDSAQVSSIASLVKAYGWREVVLVYDNTDYGRGILPYLISALQESDIHVLYQSVIPSSATSEIMMQELYKLMTMQTRVFIAKEAGMMDKGFAWITTNGVANIIDSLNPSVIEVMNGVLGVRYHVPKSRELDNFSIRWNRMYQQDNPDESPFNKLSIVGLWAYDTIWALAQAAEKVGISSATNKQPWPVKNSTCLESMVISTNGPELLTAIVQNKFRGISGDFDLTDRQLKVSVFQIINVVGGGWREIGFWSVKSGLSRQLNQNSLKTTGSASILDLNPVIWPGESTEIPRGWEIPISGKKLRVGVHTSNCPEFIKTFRDPVTNVTSASGLSVDIFEEAIKRLPFALMSIWHLTQLIQQVQEATTILFTKFIFRRICRVPPCSYIEGLLVDIGFERSKIRPYETQEDFSAALSKGSKNGGIAALVHEVPYIKLFLAKYSKGYAMVGPIYKSAGFAF
ncbi:hypothetical protein ZWY2020_040674, partial [Hordeum vulgare]